MGAESTKPVGLCPDLLTVTLTLQPYCAMGSVQYYSIYNTAHVYCSTCMYTVQSKPDTISLWNLRIDSLDTEGIPSVNINLLDTMASYFTAQDLLN